MPDSELLFKAMADGTRQRLLQLLSVHELSVSELVEILDQPQSTVSRHLRVLRQAGLLVDRRAGATVLCTACPPVALPVDTGHGRNGGGRGGNGNGPAAVALRNWLLDWARREPLDEAFERRLEVVIRRRTGAADFFETVGARWDQLRIEAFGHTFHLEALAGLLPPDWTVADVGTGTGYLLPVLAARFRKVIAVDPSEAMLDTAKQRPGLRDARNVVFREGSLARLPIADAEADLVIASLVLHHVERPGDGIAELRRCLRPSGRLLVIEQDAGERTGFHERMGDRWPGFSPGEMTAWARAAGLKDIEIRSLATGPETGRRAADAPGLFALIARGDEAGERVKKREGAGRS